ncbi:hypothetical protein GC170_07900 [bacterium]|nr:hypothetical protein [bacterium]
MPTQGRIAFRYFVIDAGENGTNSNDIGTLVITNAVSEHSTYALATLSIATLATFARKRRSQI